MRSLILYDATFLKLNDAALRLEQYQAVLNSMGEVDHIGSISTAEKNYQQSNYDMILVLVDTLTHPMQGFIQRALTVKPSVFIVNANHWHLQQLTELLACGRLTFVPESLAASRLSDLVRLAKVRFVAANNTRNEFKKLTDEMKQLKLIAQAKLIVMHQGFTEDKAHQIIQQQAMQKGLTIAQMSAQIVALMTPQTVQHASRDSAVSESGAPHFGASAHKESAVCAGM
ncbi:ANTAR domain-containing response regulator [Shewanella subflava]|uniref:ANTAR domain-containing protein n=1 Tax=Shewanella subflava TaxID=2986476 RepID=A0ABT3I718_9GAMM|nr:ANTAR domain-containing protein [Shewanella subflava]MCW3171755.1 ANTAR domain-containing protein [Shewanella subflava]